MVLFSGDGDFRSLVEALQRRGVRVTVVSTIACKPAMLADELRRQCDEFIDLVELKSKIARASTGRPARESRNTPEFLNRGSAIHRVEVEEGFEDD